MLSMCDKQVRSGYVPDGVETHRAILFVPKESLREASTCFKSILLHVLHVKCILLFIVTVSNTITLLRGQTLIVISVLP